MEKVRNYVVEGWKNTGWRKRREKEKDLEKLFYEVHSTQIEKIDNSLLKPRVL